MNEIKITLCEEDRKLLADIRDAIVTSLRAICESGMTAPKASDPIVEQARQLVEEAPKTEAPKPEAPKADEHPVESPFGEPTKTVDRKEVKSLAVRKIQAGKRDEVKALILAQGVEKIDLVPDEKLAGFLSALEAL